ncbi:MAG: ABC transporter ATP-binding protein, partial [Bacilli bacterium]|nr:ABC transporter ATP-binding protein [Bacilli bacterium]
MYKLVNVSKIYGKGHNSVNVLKNVNLTFPNRGLVSILGKSGSGKSTLLNILTGLDAPTNGTIYFQNKNLSKFKDKDKKTYQNQVIGVLFQHFNLFNDLSCLDNVTLPRLISGDSQTSSKNIAIEMFKKYHLEYLMNQKFATLSGGEKQRVALLRALVNNPKIIIADEPTGALDTRNSYLIMDELKALAKDHLVIVVTHNAQLIASYEDYRINIVDGTTSALACKNIENFQLSKNKNINHSVLFNFIKLHLKRHKIRNIISISSIAFASLCTLISFGYLNGAKQSVNTYRKESLLYSYATIAKKTIVEVPDSPIVISKLTRPSLEEISFLSDEIQSLVVENNYQAVFPIAPTFHLDHKNVDDVEFSPVYDFSLYQNIFVEGVSPSSTSFLEVAVNKEFVERFEYNQKNIINQTIQLSTLTEINNRDSLGKVIKDEINFNQKLKIVGVVNEFAYLNTPRVYYSYLGLKDFLSNLLLINYSARMGKKVFVKNIIDEADGDNPNGAYSYNLFINDISEVDKLFLLKEKYDEEKTFDITSTSYTVSSSYQSMTDVVSTSLIAFIIIVILGAIFIIVITSYSNFTQNKK